MMTVSLPATDSEEVLACEGLWTAESISRFWEYFGSRSDLHGDYFTFQVGAGVVGFLQFANRLKPGATVLDYGCGPGFLIEKLLASGARCYGLENSRTAVDLINHKFQNEKNWMGAVEVSTPQVPFPEAQFNLIT